MNPVTHPGYPSAPSYRAAAGGAFCLRPTVQAVVLALGAVALLPQALAQATEGRAAAAATPAPGAPVRLDIPAGALDAALAQFARATGVNVAYDAALVTGRVTGGVQGSLDASTGLRRLLAGSGVEAVAQPGAGYVLRVVEGRVEGGAATLPTVTVSSYRQNDVDVTSEGSHSYAAKGASILKGAQSLKEIPQSVSVITSQRIEDQNLTNVAQVVEQAPGIYANKFRAGEQTSNSAGSIYYSRGFVINSFMLDGVTSTNGDNLIDSSFGVAGSSAIYDRVEILRGAPGLLVGNGNPGGTINMVRKRPTTDFQQRYALGFGSWDNYRGEVDISGPLIESGALRGRMVVAYQDQKDFVKGKSSQEPLFYGIVDSDLSPATRVSLGYQYGKSKDNGMEYRALNAPKDFTPSRRQRYTPDWGYHDAKSEKLFVDLKHHFNDRWELSVAAQHWEYEQESLVPYVTDKAGQFAVYNRETGTNSIDINMLGAFDAFGLQHKITFGANANKQDYSYQDHTYASWNTPGWPIVYDEFKDFNAKRDWPYNAYMQDLVNAIRTGPESGKAKVRSHGFYGKLDSKLTDDLTAIIGGRASWHDYEYTNRGVYQPSSSGHVGNEFNPYAALIYALTPEWSGYASYADIFKPQWGYYTRSGNLIAHETGKNYELGIKGEFYGGRLNTAFAIYQVDLENTAQADDPPYDRTCAGNPTGGACYVNVGKKRTRGFDAEINGQLLPGWQLSAGYTYTHAKVLESDAPKGQVVNLYRLTPKHMFKLFSSYAVNDKLTVGGGMQVQSAENYTLGARVQSGYSIYSAFSRYKINKNLDVSLNINNIFDKKYFQNATARYLGAYGEPRNFMVTLRAKY